MLLTILTILYYTILFGLSIYGFWGVVTLLYFWRHRHTQFPCPTVPPEKLPTVTVQLPIYNERYVVKQLIEAAINLNYPPHLLQIQVVDDSTDDTTHIATQLVEQYQEKGVNIQLHHRHNRQGFKAGALAAALPQATGDFIAIFDADFVPPISFLQETMPHFVNKPRLGVVQARWGHINGQTSALTAAQAMAIDKHFTDQAVRYYANLFPKFNGAAGIWRRACMEDAGGWEGDTVTEDLCLSTRAVLRGWEFRFLKDVVAPAELPITINAFKNQQARWAQGAVQCWVKYGRQILESRQQRLIARLYGFFSLGLHLTHLLVVLLVVVQVPLLYLDYQFPPLLMLVSLFGMSQPLLFFNSQRALYTDWPKRLRYLPALLMIAIGIAPNTSRAILTTAMAPRRHYTFQRTPKTGADWQGSYQLPFDWIILVELFLALYAFLGLGLALLRHSYGSLLLFMMASGGLSYVVYLGWQQQRQASK